MQRTIMSVIAATMVVAVGVSVSAADPGWPADFWTTFSNRVTTARAEGTAVTTCQSVELRPAVRNEVRSEPFGTAETPFDSRDRTSLDDTASLFDSRPPAGLLIELR